MTRHKHGTKRSPLQEVVTNAVEEAKADKRLSPSGAKSSDEQQENLDQDTTLKSSDASYVFSPCSDDKESCVGSDHFDENNVSEISPESSLTFLSASFCNDTNVANVLLLRPDITKTYRTPGTSRHICRSAFIAPAIDYFNKLDIPSEIIVSILKYLNKKDLKSALLTCKRLYAAGYNSSLWEAIDLSGKTLSETALHSLLDRGAKVVKLSGSTIRSSILSGTSPKPASLGISVRLNYVDFSKIVFSDPSVISDILARCSSLQGIAFENNDLDDQICKEISKNLRLKYLSLPMCSGYSPAGLKDICKGCKSLIEANFAWSSLTAEHVDVLCNCLPVSLQRLDISGITDHDALLDEGSVFSTDALARKTFYSLDIVNLTICCPRLTDIDVSDSPSISAISMKRLLGLPFLKGITVSRCYGIDATAFMLARKLSYLNAFGCVTEGGQRILRRHLRDVRVNESHYTDIARPTRSVSRSMIWNKPTADLY